MPEIETWGIGTEMLSLRSELARFPRCLLVGFMGDSIWDRELSVISRDLKWKSSRGGQNLTEMRLETNFVYVPVAFIGAQKIPEINEISRSEEMRPWTLFNEYDRPICRRTLEEAGVPRSLFGQKKRAAGVFYYEEGLRNTMTPQSYTDFASFVKRHQSMTFMAKRLIPNFFAKMRNLNERVRKKLFTKIFYWTGLRIYVPLVFPEITRISSDALLFHWSMQKLQDKYRNAVEVKRVVVAGGLLEADRSNQ